MKSRLVMSVLVLLVAVSFSPRPASAGPVVVRFTEGVTHGFPVMRSLDGERLASGDLTQVARGPVVESRLVFRFRDGSVYDETVVFSQREVFVQQLRVFAIREPARAPGLVEAEAESKRVNLLTHFLPPSSSPRRARAAT